MMEIIYCPTCKRETGHKRHLGWGTFFGGVFTAGISLSTIPLYPKRCIVCGNDNSRPKQTWRTLEELERIHGPPDPTVQTRRFELLESLKDIPIEYIIQCPHCNQSIRSDFSECPLCSMFIPEHMTKKIEFSPSGDIKKIVSEDIKKCPFCAEDIKKEAIKCKHCGSFLNQKDENS